MLGVLPERLEHAGTAMMAGDVAFAVAAIVLLAPLGAAASAFLAVALIFVIAVAAGRYRVSFAVRARDEWYQAAAVASLGAVFGMLAALAFGLPWWGALAGAILWTLGAGLWAAALQRIRRGNRSYDAAIERIHHPRKRRSTAFELSIIRCVDVVLAWVALMLFAPLFGLIALAIRLDDGAPVLFRQRRVGRDDQDFTLGKFRTMRSDAGEAWARPGDARITRRGAFLRRTSLDELPQLFNVALGEMSLVGPRPEMREYADRFNREIPLYSLRHLVRPGLTGWAQLHLPRNLAPSDAPQVLSYDLFYVENVGVYLYLYCLIKTVCEFPAHRAV
jgi:lipopolysaccharide/colanic/teichoic acid biosynthesis glycosyltransferase